MSTLLNKRLARSLWRTKTRLFAVVMMVSVGVFAGITFSGYSHNLDGMYETLHADDDEGANLADMWIDNRSTTWSHEEVMNFCGIGSIMACRYGRTGLMRGSNNRARHNVSLNQWGTQIINSLWHGIPEFANADRVWMPSGHSEGRVACR